MKIWTNVFRLHLFDTGRLWSAHPSRIGGAAHAYVTQADARAALDLHNQARRAVGVARSNRAEVVFPNGPVAAVQLEA